MSKQEKAAAAASLTDLKQLRKALAAFAGEQAAQRKAEEQARQMALRQAERDRELFRKAVGAVRPLPRNNHAAYDNLPSPDPLPLQHWADEERVLIEAMSDEFDASTLLDVDEQLSFRRKGIGRDVVHKLAAKKVLGGVSLGRLYPGETTLENGLLIAVTEVVSEEDIETFAAALQEVLA